MNRNPKPIDYTATAQKGCPERLAALAREIRVLGLTPEPRLQLLGGAAHAAWKPQAPCSAATRFRGYCLRVFVLKPLKPARGPVHGSLKPMLRLMLRQGFFNIKPKKNQLGGRRKEAHP